MAKAAAAVCDFVARCGIWHGLPLTVARYLLLLPAAVAPTLPLPAGCWLPWRLMHLPAHSLCAESSCPCAEAECRTWPI